MLGLFPLLLSLSSCSGIPESLQPRRDIDLLAVTDEDPIRLGLLFLDSHL